MSDDVDKFKYMLATEKVVNMIFVIELTVAFLLEHEIKADTQVKNALNPILDNLRNWLKDEI